MIVGIDLAGSEKRPTGFCCLDGMNVKCCLVYKDKEIVKNVLVAHPDIVAVDAPLALPKGRKSLEEKCDKHLRACDRELLRMKIKFFPITLGPMRMLTRRGMKLKKLLERRGLKVIETYPGAVQDLLKIPRKQAGLEKLRKSLIKMGFKGDVENKNITGDELDAITCAIAGKAYLEGNYIAIGDPEEIMMILPKPQAFLF